MEIGVAHGGSTLYLASLLDLIGDRRSRIIGIDLDTSKAADLKHRRVTLLQGNCLDQKVVRKVARAARGRRTMVIADCDHSAAHVLDELRTYSEFVSPGCYYVVEDGICDVMGWDPVPGPKVASEEFLSTSDSFVEDKKREKYKITYNFGGYLMRVR